MAEPRDQIPPAAGRGHLRASHADREQVIGTLKAAFVQGMLAKDEFDLRVGQTFTSRTCAELAAVTADLPGGLTAAQPSKLARAQGKVRVLRPGAVLTVATVLYAGMWPLALYLPRDHEGEPRAGLSLVVMTGAVYLLVWVLVVVQMLNSRRDKRYGGQRPRRPAPSGGGQASRRQPSAGPDGELPPPGHGHIAEAARRRCLPRPPLPGLGPCVDGALAAAKQRVRLLTVPPGRAGGIGTPFA
jgi:hypothetical protein